MNTWVPSRSAPATRSAEAHVWRLALDQPVSESVQQIELLSDDERNRADRLRFERHRHRFILARAGLRKILGLYLERPARELNFLYGDHGKPRLALPFSTTGLEFNLSHAQDIALIAVTREARIGIDIEYVDRKVEMEGIARRFYAPEEFAAIQAAPEPGRRQAFFNCWTRKEAYLKARGDGITVNLESFAVSVENTDTPSLLRCEINSPEEWSMRSLHPHDQYVAALAMASPACRLRLLQLD
jgi:4'-phosphopantetheinyl transferase